MYVSIKTSIAIMKQKKMQYILIALMILLMSMLIYLGVSMISQTGPFEKLMERANGTENFLMSMDNYEKAAPAAEWFLDRDEVEGIIIYKSSVSDLVSTIDDVKESEIILLSEFDDDGVYNVLYVTENTIADMPINNEILVNYNHARTSGLQKGDEVTIDIQGESFEFIIKDFVVDPLFDNPFLTPNQCFVRKDFYEDNNLQSTAAVIGIKYHDINEVNDFKIIDEFMNDENQTIQPMYALYDTIERSYNTIASIIASILIGVSIIIFAIIVFVIRTTIRNQTLQRYKEIGVSKVIGYSNKQLRRSYLYTYIIIGIISSVIGSLIGIPVRRMFNKGISNDVQLGVNAGVDIYLLVAVIIVLVMIVIFTSLATREASKVMPVQAIKYGIPENQLKLHKFSISQKRRLPLSILLAIKQMLVNSRKTLSAGITLMLLIYLTLIISNIGHTLASDEHLVEHLLGMSIGDFTIGNPKDKNINETIDILNDVDYIEHAMFVKMELNNMIEDELTGEKINIGTQVIYGGINDSFLKINEGRAPFNNNEIAMTSNVAKELGKTIGDYATVVKDSSKTKVMISGLYDSITNGSKGIVEVREEIPTNLISDVGFYWVFTKEDIDLTIVQDDLTIEFGEEISVSRYDSNVSNILSTLEDFPMMVNSLLIMFLLVCGVVILNLTMIDVSNSRKSIGIMKSIGYSNAHIIGILMIKSLLIASLAVIIGFVANQVTVNIIMKTILNLTPFSTITLPVIHDVSGSVFLILLFIFVTIIGTIIPARQISKISPKQLIAE